MDIQSLRRYRIQFEKPFINADNNGIALFDLSSTFIIAWLLEPYIREYLKITRMAYYLMLLPLGVIVHLFTNQETFLGKQLFSSSFNLYKLLMIVLVYQLLKELYI